MLIGIALFIAGVFGIVLTEYGNSKNNNILTGIGLMVSLIFFVSFASHLIFSIIPICNY